MAAPARRCSGSGRATGCGRRWSTSWPSTPRSTGTASACPMPRTGCPTSRSSRCGPASSSSTTSSWSTPAPTSSTRTATRPCSSAAGWPASSWSRATARCRSTPTSCWRCATSGSTMPGGSCRSLTDEGASRGGTFGSLRTVNGVPRPTLAVPAGGDVRLRLLNIDNTRVMEVGFEGADAALIAIDGNAVTPMPLKSWRMGPAMRIDVAMRAPAAGGTVRLLDYFAAEPVELARFEARGEGLARPAFDPWPLVANRLTEPVPQGAERLRLTFSATGVAQDLVLPDGQVLRYSDGLCLSDRTFWAINRQSWPQSDHRAAAAAAVRDRARADAGSGAGQRHAADASDPPARPLLQGARMGSEACRRTGPTRSCSAPRTGPRSPSSPTIPATGCSTATSSSIRRPG